jgi:hypothetical protein
MVGATVGSKEDEMRVVLVRQKVKDGSVEAAEAARDLFGSWSSSRAGWTDRR